MIRLLILIFILPLYLIHGQSTKDLINKAEFAYCTLGDIDKTIQILKQIHETPCHLKCKFSFQFKLGELYLEKNDTNNAIKHYQIALNTQAYPGCYRSSQNCKLLPRVRTSSKSQISIKLSQIYSQKKQYKIANTYLDDAMNKHQPKTGCALAMIEHRANVMIEQAKLNLAIGDTIQARNSMLDIILKNRGNTDEAIQILYTSVKDKHSKKDLQYEIYNGIKTGQLDKENRYYTMIIFNHTTKKYIGNSKSKEAIIKSLFNSNPIKEILN